MIPDFQRITAMRLAAQRITTGEPAAPGQVVRSMLAMQGQDLPGARWSIGLRGQALTDHEVGAAFDTGDIVRSWPMRGTLHVVAAEDIGWMLELMAPRVIAATATRRAQLGITEEDLGGPAMRPSRRSTAVAPSIVRPCCPRSPRAAPSSTASAPTTCCGMSPRPARSCWGRPPVTSSPSCCWRSGCGRRDGWSAMRPWASSPAATSGATARPRSATWRAGPASRSATCAAGSPVCGDRLARLELGGITYHLAPEVLDAGPDCSDCAGGPGRPSAARVRRVPARLRGSERRPGAGARPGGRPRQQRDVPADDRRRWGGRRHLEADQRGPARS